jgi:hypothetical protein
MLVPSTVQLVTAPLAVCLPSDIISLHLCTSELLVYNSIYSRKIASSGILRRVALVRTDVSEELSTCFIKVTRIGEIGTTLAVTSNRRTLRRNTKCVDC